MRVPLDILDAWHISNPHDDLWLVVDVKDNYICTAVTEQIARRITFTHNSFNFVTNPKETPQ